MIHNFEMVWRDSKQGMDSMHTRVADGHGPS